MTPHSSSLSPALMAYLAILYEHLASRTLAEVAEGHCANSVLLPLVEVMPTQVTATFHRLDDLLCHVFRVVCIFRRANIAIDVVLHNDVECLQEDYCHLEYDIEVVGERVDQAETPQAREESLWVYFYLVLESERLWVTIEQSRQWLEVFQVTYADPEHYDANDVAYEVLIAEIAGYLDC